MLCLDKIPTFAVWPLAPWSSLDGSGNRRISDVWRIVYNAKEDPQAAPVRLLESILLARRRWLETPKHLRFSISKRCQLDLCGFVFAAWLFQKNVSACLPDSFVAAIWMEDDRAREKIIMTKDTLPLRRIDHVRFFVGNARQSAYFYRNAFGFDVVAYAGLETRRQARGRLRPAAGRDHLRAGLAAVAPTTPRASGSSSTATACRTSPWKWTTSPAAYDEAVAPRRRSASRPPTLLEDEHGVYEYATIRAYGDTTHTLRQPRPLPRRLRPRLQAARPGPLQPAARSTRSASRPSTTSSATSKKAR